MLSLSWRTIAIRNIEHFDPRENHRMPDFTKKLFYRLCQHKSAYMKNHRPFRRRIVKKSGTRLTRALQIFVQGLILGIKFNSSRMVQVLLTGVSAGRRIL